MPICVNLSKFRGPTGWTAGLTGPLVNEFSQGPRDDRLMGHIPPSPSPNSITSKAYLEIVG